MTRRTTQTTVRFSLPFELPGFDARQPAGDYRVDYEEEQMDDVTRLVWRRVGAFVYLPAIATQSSVHQMVPISLTDLQAALIEDQQQS